MNRPTDGASVRTVASVLVGRRCTVPPHAPMKEVAHVLAETGVAAATVVSAAGVVLGTVTTLDILRAQDRGPRPGRHTAAEVMHRRPITIGADTPLDQAAHLLADRRTTHLVVVDAAGAVLGVLGRRDLLALLCRPDKDIEADAEAAVRANLPSNGGAIRVSVLDGIVQLTGTMGGPSDDGRIRRAVRDIPGVIDVRDEVVHPDTATAGGRHR